MQQLKQLITDTFGVEAWIAMVITIFVLALIVSQVARMIFNQLDKWANQSPNVWDEALVGSARKPVHLVIWLIAAGWMARAMQAQWPEPQFMEEVGAVRTVGLIIAFAWFGWKFSGHMTRNIITQGQAKSSDFDVTTVYALSKLARLVIVVLAVITVAQSLGFNIGALLALGGVGGIAVGLAAKDLLANFFGGLTIYLDRPFKVGEWIRSPDKSIEGTVEYISWRHTRIRAFNKNPIYVPNAVFTSIVVENPSRMSHRRIKETLGLRYDDFAQVESVVKDVKSMIHDHPDMDNTQTLIVNFNHFGASSLDIMIYAFTKTRNWVEYHRVKQDVLLKIGNIVERHGAEIAFPTQTLHIAGQESMQEGENAPVQDAHSAPRQA
ncbi:mechanosensitive ion channel family protein [Hydrogenophaga sp. 5NK40-0174]|uniref:mechanosensitive ion channel family protein n=1 Tax=Hydrogenophaga sp. 5NK40-0174 TaxID=3127649 RepID=UPI0031042C2B